jgi:hypothetical protein
MILMRTNPLQGTLEGMGPENRDFFWALKWQSECHLNPKKLRFSRPTPSDGPCNGFAPIKGEGAVRSVFTSHRSLISLMGANPLQGALEEVGPENRDFFWPSNGKASAS